jgi:hypothetical protein
VMLWGEPGRPPPARVEVRKNPQQCFKHCCQASVYMLLCFTKLHLRHRPTSSGIQAQLPCSSRHMSRQSHMPLIH